ncbi:longitudinals lacking protein, isoforms A/B/D/L-like isoform X1 [Bombyx mandarina]|uniref:Longitudinals lacking protein, isoforms A/B/D/L-like isoform X1 n=1 Tax=Bombyx mandarina TaxID=7092 RepID=A0A6J2JLM1_BOMMA|nr:longitudinals lacking protein, isoforms A/B/D/L-like isoform X1 [Bombyx mandarina]XP_028030536.1 longitudinals lacking protein, isoforms A/B/D/L-like isoform X1 [Bombyx mandarina]XP_028030538.1 longitudinals lacking protein, isoforms A/B/D/L-like isoform X1 [Bombyx mandarina]
MDDDQQFCLRWNNHQSTLVSVFDTLLEKGMHVDCTLAAEGQTLKAHKVVLSACSPYFESVLSQQYDKHPIIILKDVKYAELRAMMDYMYRGEVNISQDQLAALLKAAESLQIKGLSDNKPSRPPSRPQPTAPAPAVPATAPPAPPAPLVPPLAARTASPAPLGRDASPDSREGSLSPSRRRKKARRGSGAAHNGASPPPPPAPPKDELSRADTLEDLTLDDEHHDDAPPPSHNDVVRNFQWHMERSQDEIMNSSDNAREQQGRKPTTPRQSIVTRSKKVMEESGATTLAILKNVKSPPAPSPPLAGAPPGAVCPPSAAACPSPADLGKENAARPAAPNPPPAPPAAPADSRYNIFPRADRVSLPCAQYKTDKGYKCPNCQRCYNARKNLVRHVTLECGRDPQYKCPHCAYSKHRRNELKKHIEKKHPGHALAVN